MNDITWVQEANRFNVLLDGFIVLLLLEQLVSVLLNDLTLDLLREVGFLGDRLSFSIMRLLHQVVDLDVVLHGVELDKLANAIVLLVKHLSDVVDALLTLSLFDLNVNYLAIGRWAPEHRDLILKVVDR